MGRRIGILGGTFDPIHIGHLIVAQDVAEKCRLDQVLFVPSAVPPHKRDPDIVSAELRAQMVGLAISSDPRFALSRVEIDRKGVSYTVDTLRQLLDELGEEPSLYLIVGRDNAEELASWSRPEEVVRLAHVVVADRGQSCDDGDPNLMEQMTFLDTRKIDVSSTEVRRRVRAGLPIRYLVPEAVSDFIRSNGLYT
jgi:nicotinate-nucleotide adenylyltransferase